jgi:hypothetical protein
MDWTDDSPRHEILKTLDEAPSSLGGIESAALEDGLLVSFPDEDDRQERGHEKEEDSPLSPSPASSFDQESTDQRAADT